MKIRYSVVTTLTIPPTAIASLEVLVGTYPVPYLLHEHVWQGEDVAANGSIRQHFVECVNNLEDDPGLRELIIELPEGVLLGSVGFMTFDPSTQVITARAHIQQWHGTPKGLKKILGVVPGCADLFGCRFGTPLQCWRKVKPRNKRLSRKTAA